MDIEDLTQVAGMDFMQSRIPALDALVAFVPDGRHDPRIDDIEGPSRWFPQEGGTRVIAPYEGQPFDAEVFHVEKGAWDHEHCSHCQATIEAMTLCWVTVKDPYVLLCEACHARLAQKK